MGASKQQNQKSIMITCSSSPDNGKGISTYSRLIAGEFARQGYLVHYLCPKSTGFSGFNNDNIKHLYFDPRANPVEQTKSILAAIGKIENLVGIINNDVIFVQVLAPVVRVPILSIVHMATYSIGKSALVNHEFIDYTVAISYDMYKTLTKNKLDPIKCALVLNGVIPNTTPTTLEFERLKMMTGVEFSVRKGGHALLLLLRRLKASSLDFSFVWFGNIPQKITAEFSADSRFEFFKHLPREEYLAKVQNSNIYLFPSKEEGCPMSLKEAMNEGLVPIAADGIGAMKQIIQNGLNGYLLNAKNWDATAFELITKFEKDPSPLTSISKNAQATIVDSFSIERVVNNLASLLNRPTVNRQAANPQELEYYQWHRLHPDFSKRSLPLIWDLVKFKVGILVKAP